MKNLFLACLSILLFVAFGFFSCSNSKDANGKKSDTLITSTEVIKQMKTGKPLIVKDKHITGVLNFTNASTRTHVFDMSAIYIDVEVIFINCVFEDSVHAYLTDWKEHRNVYSVFEKNVTFNMCTFKKGLNMSQSDFRGRFAFDLCRVEGNAAFDGSTFRMGVSFGQANFLNPVSFASCTFAARNNFLKTFFKGSVIFQYCRFNDITMFTDSYFYGYTDFSKTYSSSSLDFTNVQFFDRVLFCNSLFLSNIKFAKSVFKDDFNFTGNTVLGELNVKNADFENRAVFKDNIFSKMPDATNFKKGSKTVVEDFSNQLLSQSKINVLNLKR